MRDETGALRVGMIDGAVDTARFRVAGSRDFSGAGAILQNSPSLSHGNGVAARVTGRCTGTLLYVARIFGDSLACTPRQVAEAIDWLVEEQVALINMSFGLRHDRQVLRESCRKAVDRGICLVAATPARGQGVYPSRYPGVVRATGDARCGPGEIAWLRSEQADFGGYPGRPQDSFAGASAGCASVSGAIAGLWNNNHHLNLPGVLEALAASAAYRGPESRPGCSPP